MLSPVEINVLVWKLEPLLTISVHYSIVLFELESFVERNLSRLPPWSRVTLEFDEFVVGSEQ